MTTKSITTKDTTNQHIIRILTVEFDYQISNTEIPLWRGAVISASNRSNVLFHNHVEDKYRYAYPLIQYKKVNRMATLVGINEGADALAAYIAQCDFNFKLGKREVSMHINHVDACKHTLMEPGENKYTYQMYAWMPLNEMNYEIYKDLEYLDERISFLEKVLTANILSFAKCMHIFFETIIKVKLTSILSSYEVTYKSVKMQAFDITFTTNIELPEYIGLGRNVSLGYGTICK